MRKTGHPLLEHGVDGTLALVLSDVEDHAGARKLRAKASISRRYAAMHCAPAEPGLFEQFWRPPGKVHLAPTANRADVDELQARSAVQVLPQIGNEPLLDGEVAIVPEDRIDLGRVRVKTLECHRRHSHLEHPLRRHVLAGGVHVLRHEAKGDPSMPAIHPQVEDGTEVLVEAVLSLRLPVPGPTSPAGSSRSGSGRSTTCSEAGHWRRAFRRGTAPCRG